MNYFGKPAAATNQKGGQRKGVLSKPASNKSMAGKPGVLSKGKSRCASCGNR